MTAFRTLLYVAWALCCTLLVASIAIPSVDVYIALGVVAVTMCSAIYCSKRTNIILLSFVAVALLLSSRFFVADIAYTINALLIQLAELQLYVTPLDVPQYPALYEGTFYSVCMMTLAFVLLPMYKQQKKRPFIVVSAVILLLQLVLQATPNVYVITAYYVVTLLVVMTFVAECTVWRYSVSGVAVLAVVLASCAYALPNENKAFIKTTNALDDWRYTTELDVSMPDGQLQAMKPFERYEHTALTLAMEQPAAMYLRGFVGSTFSNNEWAQLAPVTYVQQKSLFEALKAEQFTPATQLYTAAQLVADVESATIAVQHEAASRNYMYAPYELAVPLVEARTVDYTMYESAGWRGEEQYTYDVMTTPFTQYPQIAEQLEYVDRATYFDYETHYRDYVYSMFTAIDEEARITLQHHISSMPIIETYEQAIRFVQQFASDNITYDEQGSASYDDFLQHVLEENKTGYAPHFATVSTLLFRMLDIPARYVEGYIVTPENVKDKTAFSEIDIAEANAHAWTEIYIDTLGWVPVEVTPPYKDVMPSALYTNAAQSTTSATGGAEQQIEQQSSIPLQVQKQQNEPLPPEEQANQKNWRFAALLPLLVCVLFVLLLVAYKRTKRLRKFSVASNADAVIAMFSYVQHMLRYGETVAINEPFTNELAQGRAIYERAMYSAEPISIADRTYMRRLFKTTYTHVKKQQKITSKLPFMWRYM